MMIFIKYLRKLKISSTSILNNEKSDTDPSSIHTHINPVLSIVICFEILHKHKECVVISESFSH